MKNLKIGVLDSGVGGLSVLKAFNEAFDDVDFIYFGDSENAPYGNKSKKELSSLTVNNIYKLILNGANCIVLGCNTLSLTVLNELKNVFDLPIFGVFPPVESLLVNGDSVLLLSTVRTSECYFNHKNLKKLALKDLALDIELNALDLEKLNLYYHFKNEKANEKSVILGCTHYSLAKNIICDHLKPRKFVDGIDNTVDYVNKILKIAKSPVKQKRNSIKFIGKNAEFNEMIWKKVVNDKQKNIKSGQNRQKNL